MAKTPRTKRGHTGSIEHLISEVRERPESVTLSGRLTDDRNFPGRRLLVVNPAHIVSINQYDILDEGATKGGMAVVNVRASAQVWRTSPTVMSIDTAGLRVPVQMEFFAPPPSPAPGKNDPKPATADDTAALANAVTVIKSIAGAASEYNESCTGGDNTEYENNCAHFLSDAFIRAGYTELSPPNDCVNARCAASAKRPIRARDMWCWFKKMATESQTTLPSKKGFWAVFQLKESEYWGGHVVIIDTDKGKYYGTGNYPGWDQYAYKW